ncbi:hypothetical protein AGABI1DRAFT_80074 [Agaricus bisporus var. burnettii JB137-S8]|uniref:separase n=1 Tax=Agaricus bisporus var. burnettii (strain JB137-S8 / ATCC MYA-4627 / FGSC 10392) TaxID=597362 RepID=K5WJ64_AGABU|nr:uncharacterized protein AGABI1DRAFT_80074 [Agaricus bisporus var. burnettii JB137-S8]EKM75331.1 hypothetical protein AGABI1DRAFT_80074 [Agaricus bisporus var. burnettii JB137-S8]
MLWKSSLLATEEGLVERIESCVTELRTSTILVQLLEQIDSTTAEVDVKRIAAKVDRALERLRRSASTWLERYSAARDCTYSQFKELLLTITTFVRCKLSSSVIASLSDLTTRALDSLFVVSKFTLDVQASETYTITHDYLARANSILTNVNQTGIPLSNYLRCLSGAYYNFAGNLYQSGRHGPAVTFLKDACSIGGRALTRRPKEKVNGEEKSRELEGWKQLEETLFRRWELLGICHIKLGDRKNAYIAFLQSLVAFPYSICSMEQDSNKLPPSSIFGPAANNHVKQLAAIIDRLTYLGMNELLIPAEQISFRHSLSKCSSSEPLNNPKILGLLVEQQVESLEQRGSKGSIQRAIRVLLESALEVYDGEVKTPVRRARVMLRLLEVMYRTDEVPAFERIQEMNREIEKLLSAEILEADSELAPYRAQYRALAHLWLALHAHRAAIPNQVSLVSDHLEHACRILRSTFSKSSNDSPRVVLMRKSLTPQRKSLISQQPPAKTMTTRRRAVATATTTIAATKTRTRTPANTSTVAKKTKAAATTRPVLQPMSLNTATPPRAKREATRELSAFDNFAHFSGVLRMSARPILGLLSLGLPKVQLLDVSRRLAETHSGPTSEGYISASLDLAHEYMRIGKTRRATSVFHQALDSVRGGKVSDEMSALFLLRYAESLALSENIPRSCSVYREAIAVYRRIDYEEKTGTTVQRIHARVRRLEKAALAARTVAMIQHCKEDLTSSTEFLLQSLRIWNRALDNLSHPKPQTITPPQRHLDSFVLRICEGLFTVLFDLTQAYLHRGSAKESEFFISQALDLAQALNAPAMLSRASAKQGEVQVRLGNLKEGYETLVKAGEVLSGVPTIESVEVVRLTAECRERMGVEGEGDAQVLYGRSMDLLTEMDAAFEKYEGVAFGPRKSLGMSPVNSKIVKDMIVPEVLMNVLRQQIWLLRDQNDDQFNSLLKQFISLPRSSLAKAQENSLLAKLNLHNVYLRFRGDMFLNSLAESPISIPIGMHAAHRLTSVSAKDINGALDQAEERFWDSLNLVAQRGNVLDIRESAVALAVIKSFQTSMGRKDSEVHVMVSRLLDASSALTLRREMLEAIHHKFPRLPAADDLQWPLVTSEGNLLPPSGVDTNLAARRRVNIPVDSEDEDDDAMSDLEPTSPLKAYWDSVRARYRSYSFNPTTLSSSQTKKLPSNWTVIHINVTEDKNTLFVSRQEGGPDGDGLVFSVPLRSRRDTGNGDDEEDYLSFDNAIEELREIVRLSDEGTKAAIHVKPDDDEARAAWWKQRAELDSRLKTLLENIEFCWFGAFKTILSPKCKASSEDIIELRSGFEKVFKRSFGIREKKRPGTHRKTPSQPRSQSFSQVQLDDSLLRCFSTLSPKCQDEELEDMIYFILDLYQFHGVAIPTSEVDITQMVVDVRMVLEEHSVKTRGSKRSGKQSGVAGQADDEHVFLVLDKNLQGLPWESIPILRGRSVSRIPSVDFLLDRLEYVEMRRRTQPSSDKQTSVGAVVDPRKGYFILNPSGDLRRTQERFQDWAKGMKEAGWDGVIGKPVSEQQFENALRQRDLVVYFGHGGGEQYLRTYKVRRLQSCAATMLWGCSSGALREMGDFDRTGTANAYMLAGCPTLVANLWDVTDRDIDKFCQTVFDKIQLNPENVRAWNGSTNTPNMSLVSAVAHARSACKLKYLTGAAPVVYGIPFYL